MQPMQLLMKPAHCWRRTARNHGLQMVGLPSRQAAFEPDQRVTWHGRRSWWQHEGGFVQLMHRYRLQHT